LGWKDEIRFIQFIIIIIKSQKNLLKKNIELVTSPHVLHVHKIEQSNKISWWQELAENTHENQNHETKKRLISPIIQQYHHPHTQKIFIFLIMIFISQNLKNKISKSIFSLYPKQNLKNFPSFNSKIRKAGHIKDRGCVPTYYTPPFIYLYVWWWIKVFKKYIILYLSFIFFNLKNLKQDIQLKFQLSSPWSCNTFYKMRFNIY